MLRIIWAGSACSSLNALNTPNTKNITTVQIGVKQVSFDLAPEFLYANKTAYA